ncbi:helicase-related protein [Methanobrevibacter arboriphilus]|uniref:helicase-related protein n=1 Tax=Methanobrevibacter arboriphilus TaxID=39441 RepID=UPI00373FE042
MLREYNNKSSKGFPGQTIVFTNSRRKTHQISDYLTKKRIKSAAYHGGLSYFKKKKELKKILQMEKYQQL